MCESENDTGVVYQAPIIASGHKSKFYPYRCHTKPMIHINYRLDPTLTVMLSLVRMVTECDSSFTIRLALNSFWAGHWTLLIM